MQMFSLNPQIKENQYLNKDLFSHLNNSIVDQ